MTNRAAVLVLAPLILLAAGCDPIEGAGEPSSTPPVTMPSAPPVAGSSAPPVTQPSAPPGSAAPSVSPPQSSLCHTGELKVTSQAGPGGGAAGSEYAWLVFTNVSGRTCTLYGYPGVSWVTGPSGQQVNDPVQRRTDVTPTRVVLTPGGVAHAQVRHANPELYGPDCHPVQVAGFRVYPPDETAAVFVPWASQACSAKGVNVGEVWPIAAGLSE